MTNFTCENCGKQAQVNLVYSKQTSLQTVNLENDELSYGPIEPLSYHWKEFCCSKCGAEIEEGGEHITEPADLIEFLKAQAS